MFTISQRFFFDAAHSLVTAHAPEQSARIHGHTYHCEVFVSGEVDPKTGMVMDLGLLRKQIASVRELLDHHNLDEVSGLGLPTLESLARFVAERLQANLLAPLVAVRVWRESIGDSCMLRLE